LIALVVTKLDSELGQSLSVYLMTGAVAAIAGASVGLAAVLVAASPAKIVVVFVAALIGAFQGAAVVWFIVGPDLALPPAWSNDPKTRDEREDETPNPPTAAP